MITRGDEFNGAEFSDDERYRYMLWRDWDPGKPTFTACMLNPSTADEVKNDPTVERVERRARMLGYGKLIVVNLFAYRSTDPAALLQVDDPVGGEANNSSIVRAVQSCELALLGWGQHGQIMSRGLRVLHMLNARGLNKRCRYLKLTKNHQPGHPLYIGYGETLKEFR